MTYNQGHEYSFKDTINIWVFKSFLFGEIILNRIFPGDLRPSLLTSMPIHFSFLSWVQIHTTNILCLSDLQIRVVRKMYIGTYFLNNSQPYQWACQLVRPANSGETLLVNPGCWVIVEVKQTIRNSRNEKPVPAF